MEASHPKKPLEADASQNVLHQFGHFVIVSNGLKFREPQCLSMTSFAEPQHVTKIAASGDLV